MQFNGILSQVEHCVPTVSTVADKILHIFLNNATTLHDIMS